MLKGRLSRKIICLIVLMIRGSWGTDMTDKDTTLPGYVALKDWMVKDQPVILQPATSYVFPLTSSDITEIRTLEAKFDQEQNCAGLAGPQIGLAKRVIVFAAPDDAKLKKWRPSLTQCMPKTIWINPSYEGVGHEMQEEFEGCFSVEAVGAPVPRFQTIRYKACDIDGQEIIGTAVGFLARVIQHEIDHTNGILFVDRADPDKVLPIQVYRERHAQELAEKKAKEQIDE